MTGREDFRVVQGTPGGEEKNTNDALGVENVAARKGFDVLTDLHLLRTDTQSFVILPTHLVPQSFNLQGQ